MSETLAQAALDHPVKVPPRIAERTSSRYQLKIDNRPLCGAHWRRVDTTRCLHPSGYGECIKPLQASFAKANEFSNAST
jgi:hypothetical protein